MNYITIHENLSKDIREILKEYYSIDFLNAQISLNTIANNNRVFLIKTKEGKYILRESSSSKSLDHLQLEVKVLTYLHEKDFSLTPFITPNVTGNPITIYKKKYYILENFLPGTVKKNVNNLVDFNERKQEDLFSALAEFTRASEDFECSIPKNNQTIFYYIKNGSRLLTTSIKKIKNKTVADLIENDFAFIINFIKETKDQLDTIDYDTLQKQIVHFDLHPGNVNYMEDKLVGIFDFDWVRFDHRLADLACTLGQSCYSYQGKQRALYDKKKIALGLKAYRKAYGKSEYNSDKESEIIIAALRGYMFFQLLWIMEWYIKNPENKDGYKYIQFSLDVLKQNDFDKLIESKLYEEKNTSNFT
jgi:Ser/Thr protein kinase RdoA (MazF antagonist)